MKTALFFFMLVLYSLPAYPKYSLTVYINIVAIPDASLDEDGSPLGDNRVILEPNHSTVPERLFDGLEKGVYGFDSEEIQWSTYGGYAEFCNLLKALTEEKEEFRVHYRFQYYKSLDDTREAALLLGFQGRSPLASSLGGFSAPALPSILPRLTHQQRAPMLNTLSSSYSTTYSASSVFQDFINIPPTTEIPVLTLGTVACQQLHKELDERKEHAKKAASGTHALEIYEFLLSHLKNAFTTCVALYMG